LEEEEEEAAGLEVGLYDSTSDCGCRKDKDRGFEHQHLRRLTRETRGEESSQDR
jgi:hypothetical protein